MAGAWDSDAYAWECTTVRFQPSEIINAVLWAVEVFSSYSLKNPRRSPKAMKTEDKECEMASLRNQAAGLLRMVWLKRGR